MSPSARPVVDPITLEVIRGAMSSTIREMELLMERCAMSPFIKEKKDYFVGVYDHTGRIVASPVYVLYYFRAWDEARRRPILCIEGLGVGLGARPFADGVDVIYYIGQENYPVEYVERDFPLRVERYAVRPDSGGPGLHRGGTGVIRDVRVLCERAEIATRMENTVVAPYGVAGGRAGRTGRVVLNPGTPTERVLPGQGDGIALTRGDLVRLETCGGGGWGDPLTRDPMRVRDDVARGFVTPPGSLEDYGVVLDPVTLSVDKNATDEARARRAGPLTLIDRGEGFAKAEASWQASVIDRPSTGATPRADT